MQPNTAVIWIFVAIFVATAIIALGSLPGWIPVPDYYRKKLFILLILEVVACVIAFGKAALESYREPVSDFKTILIGPEYGWDWQYAQKSWRSSVKFSKSPDGKLSFKGSTWIVDPSGKRSEPIIRWESARPFDISPNAKSVTFEATRTWTEAAAEKYPELTKSEVEKKIDTQITLKLGPAIEGSATDPTSAKDWGIMLTTAFPD